MRRDLLAKGSVSCPLGPCSSLARKQSDAREPKETKRKKLWTELLRGYSPIFSHKRCHMALAGETTKCRDSA